MNTTERNLIKLTCIFDRALGVLSATLVGEQPEAALKVIQVLKQDLTVAALDTVHYHATLLALDKLCITHRHMNGHRLTRKEVSKQHKSTLNDIDFDKLEGLK